MWRFKRTALIITFCGAILVGLATARYLSINYYWWLLLFTPAFLLLKNKNLISLILIVVLGVSIGLYRGGIYMQKLDELKSLSGQKVTFSATAKTDAVYGKNAQIEFIANRVTLLPYDQSIAGNFKISGFGVPMVYRGDRVEVSGKLYPMRGSNQARVAYAQLSVISPDSNWINKLTRTFSAGMQTALPEPASSFGSGILVGQRTNLPAGVVNQLTLVGLVHIVAVSGYNLTILVRAAQRLRISSKYQRTLMSIGLIITFTLVTGFSASIVRASIVSLFGLWAWYYGRNLKPVLIILLAAALTALFNPFYLWSDIGWYLSFLAFFGVLVIAPAIISYLFRRTPSILTIILIETISAEIMTLPLIMMIFGQMSLVALLANVLIVPLIPWAMLLATIAAVAGATLPELSGWFAWPAKMLLTYILDVVKILSSIPNVMQHIKINPTVMISAYMIVLTFVITLHKRLKNKQLILTQKS